MQADTESPSEFLSITCSLAKAVYCIAMNSRVLFDDQFEEIATPSIKTFLRRPTKGACALAWLTSLQDRNLNAVEIGWPFRLGLQGCIVDRSQDIGWQRTFGHGRKIAPEMLQRRGADDDTIIAFGV